jgi:hypothetical protein
MFIMKRNENLLNKRLSVRSLGALLGGTFLAAVVAGVIWHMGDIKRLVKISQM